MVALLFGVDLVVVDLVVVRLVVLFCAETEMLNTVAKHSKTIRVR